MISYRNALYSDFQASCNAKAKSVERHLHALMCSVSVVTVVFIHTTGDDQRLNTLVQCVKNAFRFSIARSLKITVCSDSIERHLHTLMS